MEGFQTLQFDLIKGFYTSSWLSNKEGNNIMSRLRAHLKNCYLLLIKTTFTDHWFLVIKTKHGGKKMAIGLKNDDATID